MPRSLRALFLLVDVGFLLYWLVTALHVIPATWAFKDYDDPVLSTWNWSFLPLDLAVSSTGLASVALARRDDGRWRSLALLSLAFTSASGLQAIAFWALRGDFDLAWWLPNLFLLAYPVPYAARLVRSSALPEPSGRR
jgi:hypothetical protein